MSTRKLYSLKTEVQVLVVLLAHSSGKARNFVLSKTEPDDFGSKEGREIRQRVTTLLAAGKRPPPIDVFADDPGLTGEARNVLRVASTAVAVQQASTYSKGTILALLDVMTRYRKMRAVVEGAQRILGAMQREMDTEALLEVERQFDKTLAELRRTTDKAVLRAGVGMTPQEVVDGINKGMVPDERSIISTGLFGLDAAVGGFKRGELAIVSATRGGGKTAVAAQMQVNQYRAGLNIGVVQLEMEHDQSRDRLWSNISGVPHYKIRDKTKLNKTDIRQIRREVFRFYQTGAQNGNKLHIWHISDPKYRPEAIETELAPDGFDVIYVDYLTLFAPQPGEQLWMAQKEYSRYLKQLAKRLNCVIVVLTQLSDDDRVKYGRGPEEDADWWLWWRYGEEERANGNVEMKLDKARHGRPCVFPAAFDLARMRIETSAPLANEDEEKKEKKTGLMGPTKMQQAQDRYAVPNTDFAEMKEKK